MALLSYGHDYSIKMCFLSLARLARFTSLILLLDLSLSTSYAVAATAAILYPDLREPYREVITDVIDGIREEMAGEVKLFAVDNDFDHNALKRSLATDDIGVIIVLGRGGFTVVQKLNTDIPVVVGALLISPDEGKPGLSGISLAADPDRLLAELKSLAPAVKTVSVVYKPANSGWLVELAQQGARRLGLQLNAYPVQDIKSAAQEYRDIFKRSRPGLDAIWLLPDPAVVDDAVILPLILKESWDKSVAVFSTNPAHAKRGVLFAMFPNNRAMGVRLARIAKQRLNDNGNGGEIVPLADLQAALNTRTADHLGLVIPIDRQRKFALTFPAAR